MSHLRRRFGNLVAANRKRAGLTQEQLAAAAEMSVDMVARIEAGKTGVRFGSIEKLSAALRLDPAELFIQGGDFKAGARPVLNDLTARLDRLSDDDLRWVSVIIEAALKPR